MKYLGNPQSGSYAQNTASRNRFGQYFRTRAIPVNPRSGSQSQARARLANLSETWDTLSDVERAGWAGLGLSMERTDSLGQTYNLTGLQAFVSVNSLNLAAGNASTTAAGALSTPASMVSMTLTISATVFSVAYTATPLAAGNRLFIFASPQRSKGRTFEADYRLIAVTAAAAASPASIFTAYSARLGTPVVGNKIFVMIQQYSNGFASFPLTGSAVVA